MPPAVLVSWTLVMVAAVTVIWPLNIPLVALAYKVRHGGAPIPLETANFWARSTFASLGLCVLSLVLVGLVYALVRGAGMPPEIMDLMLLMAYVPAAVWFLFWMFALEDMLEGLSLFLLYILLPALPIFLIGRFTGLWQKLADGSPWLLITH
ncbi:MAG TPA: hypothetical protein VG013_34295 [Gemmataceae bacterium]|nr:hypothetical protein [Gemmataceae bacterium]